VKYYFFSSDVDFSENNSSPSVFLCTPKPQPQWVNSSSLMLTKFLLLLPVYKLHGYVRCTTTFRTIFKKKSLSYIPGNMVFCCILIICIIFKPVLCLLLVSNLKLSSCFVKCFCFRDHSIGTKLKEHWRELIIIQDTS
jgi:hypothetical protein